MVMTLHVHVAREAQGQHAKEQAVHVHVYAYARVLQYAVFSSLRYAAMVMLDTQLNS